MKSSVKAVIFDCFGVFYVDSFKHFIALARPEIQQELTDIMHQEDLGILTSEQVVQQYSKLTGEAELALRHRLYETNMVRDAALLAYSQTLRPQYKVGLLSNLGPREMDTYFTQAERQKYFDAVVISGDVGFIKPQPEIYEIMSQQLEVAPQEAVMIDDTPANVTGARNVGMHGIVYTNLAALKHDLPAVLQE